MMANQHKQHGAALITGLIFMVVLTLLAVASMRNTGLEEKMAANAQNQNMAFQAAEAALRQGLSQIYSGAITSASGFTAGCTTVAPIGLCMPSAPGVAPIWTTQFPFGQTTPTVSGAATYSGTPLLNVANQPQYIIELLPSIPCPDCSIGSGRGGGAGTATPFRVTARGWGQAPEAQATTQATFMYY
ncbi:MAG: pilus assembly PilX family protein [Sulfuriferula sp.]